MVLASAPRRLVHRSVELCMLARLRPWQSRKALE